MRFAEPVSCPKFTHKVVLIVWSIFHSSNGRQGGVAWISRCYRWSGEPQTCITKDKYHSHRSGTQSIVRCAYSGHSFVSVPCLQFLVIPDNRVSYVDISLTKYYIRTSVSASTFSALSSHEYSFPTPTLLYSSVSLSVSASTNTSK
jgi:hypothetical protein